MKTHQNTLLEKKVCCVFLTTVFPGGKFLIQNYIHSFVYGTLQKALYGLERGGNTPICRNIEPIKAHEALLVPLPSCYSVYLQAAAWKRGRGPSAAHMWELISSVATGVWVRRALPIPLLRSPSTGGRAGARGAEGPRGRGIPALPPCPRG